MIRKATPSDVPAIVRLGLQALQEDAWPRVRIDPRKVEAWVKLGVSAASHFVWVAEVDGEVKGAIAAHVDDCLFYERKQATVMQFYAKDAPGEGIKLIRAFLRWARSRPAIKIIAFTLEANADPRIGKMLERLGLSIAMPVYLEIK